METREEAKLVDPADFHIDEIQFKHGHPHRGTDMPTSLHDEIYDLSSLNEAVRFLDEHENLRVQIVGFADTYECNESDCDTLSRRRAKAVYDWLLEHGVEPSQLEGYRGMGITQPIDLSETEFQRKNNRRVEFKVMSEPET